MSMVDKVGKCMGKSSSSLSNLTMFSASSENKSLLLELSNSANNKVLLTFDSQG
jgi:hypothetical protein